ncbi:MAG: nucleotidyltransferase domain-containing protein [Coriobacteriales bacterium]|jgi:predicted nucleotidyltransferase|nr:nucleotidyltransferase domain-containing protein [Coriobacteriales bacterium]
MLTHEAITAAVAMAARQYPLAKVSYFGSYADGNANEASDLDLLVEFIESSVSVLTILDLKYYLEDLLEKQVEVVHAPIPDAAIIEIGHVVFVYWLARHCGSWLLHAPDGRRLGLCSERHA